MKIGIIGGGTVGKATARCWLEHCDEVRVWDQAKELRTTEDLDSVFEVDMVFICLPETSLEHFVDAIPTAHRDRNLVLKSTVPIGTTRRLAEKYRLSNIVHSPEFLTARCSLTDAQMPARNIIGDPTNSMAEESLAWRLHDLYAKRFPGVQVFLMSSDESEAVKLIVNSFFATKIGFFNEARSLCDKLGLDWNAVLEGVLSDGRIAHAHTQVPGPDGKRGFGGRCLPKDLRMLLEAFYDADVARNICQGAELSNLAYRPKEES